MEDALTTDATTSPAPTSSSERLRRAAHVGVGLLAYVAPIVGWEIAFGMSALAFVVNKWFLRFIPVLRTVRDVPRGDRGVWIYPLVIAVLVFVFRERLWIAQCGWLAVGVGDGLTPYFARLVRGGPRWPTRRDKRVAPSLLGGAAAALAVLPIVPGCSPVVACAVGGFALLADALPAKVDDNLGWPVFAVFGVLLATS